MIQYVLYSQSIDTTDILQYNTEPKLGPGAQSKGSQI